MVWTRERNTRDHVVRCMEDWRYCFATEYKIALKEGGTKYLTDLKPGQERLMAAWDRQKRERGYVRLRVIKGRRVGSTTVFALRMYHDTQFNKGFITNVIAHRKKSTNGIFEMMKRAYRSSSDAIRPEKRKGNAIELVFDRKEGGGLDSKISISTAGEPEAERSALAHNLLLSEPPFYPDSKKKKLITTVMQTVPDFTGAVVMEGTSNGMEYWYRICTEGQFPEYEEIFISFLDDPDTVAPVTEHWAAKFNRMMTLYKHYDMKNKVFAAELETLQRDLGDVPDHDLNIIREHDLPPERYRWYLHVLHNKTPGDTIEERIDLRSQEYPLTKEASFIGSGRPSFDRLKLYAMLNRKMTPQKYDLYTNPSTNLVEISENPRSGVLKIFQMPKKGERYIIGVDSEEGVGADNTSIPVFQQYGEGADHFLQVANISQVSLDPEEAGDLAYFLAILYNRAWIVPEVDNTGQVVVRRITRHWEYTNVFTRKRWDTAKRDFTFLYGYRTRGNTRNAMLSMARKALKDDKLILVDADTIKEFIGMAWNEQKRRDDHAEGEHDDEVIGTCLAIVGSEREVPDNLPHHAHAEAEMAVNVDLNPDPFSIAYILDRDLQRLNKESAYDGWF